MIMIMGIVGLVVIVVLMMIHFGTKPRNGGSPPKESILIIIRVWFVGDV